VRTLYHDCTQVSNAGTKYSLINQSNQLSKSVYSKKGSENRSSRFELEISLIAFSGGSGLPLKHDDTPLCLCVHVVTVFPTLKSMTTMCQQSP